MKNIIIKRQKNEILLIFSAFWSIAVLMLQLLLYAYWGTNSTIHFIMLVVAAVPILLCIKHWICYNLFGTIMIYLCFTLIFLFNCLIFPENRAYLNNYLFYLFFMCIPSFISISMVEDNRNFDLVLGKLSIFIFACGIILFIKNVIAGTATEYSMSFGYYLMMPLLYHSYIFVKKRKRITSAIVIIACVCIIALTGSRGPLVAWICYIISIAFVSDFSKKLKGLIILLSVGVIVFFDFIVDILLNMSNLLGIESRTLNLYLNNEFITHDSGRMKIWNTTIEMIKEHPLIGNGIGADYKALGIYTHNLFLDLAVHFGLIAAILFSGVLIYYLIKAFVKCNDKNLFLMLFCMGFIPLMVSGTWLSSAEFFILMGFCKKTIGIRFVISHKSRNNTFKSNYLRRIRL